VAPEVVDGGGVIGIVIVGDAMTGDDDGGGAEAASARSLRRHATAAKAITTMTTAISAARARDLFTGRSPRGTRVPSPYSGDADTHSAETRTHGSLIER
jgi:hypothetical protein